jgi:hypothetical protein
VLPLRSATAVHSGPSDGAGFRFKNQTKIKPNPT